MTFYQDVIVLLKDLGVPRFFDIHESPIGSGVCQPNNQRAKHQQINRPGRLQVQNNNSEGMMVLERHLVDKLRKQFKHKKIIYKTHICKF